MPSIPKLTQEGKRLVAILEGLESALKAKGIHEPKLDDLKKRAKEIFKVKPRKQTSMAKAMEKWDVPQE